jgi:hypothetical protein
MGDSAPRPVVSINRVSAIVAEQRAISALFAKKPRGRFVEFIAIVADLTDEFARLVSRDVMLLCEVSDFVGPARSYLPAIGPAAPLLAAWHFLPRTQTRRHMTHRREH